MITDAEVEAALKVIANIRYVDPMKEVVPISFYRKVTRIALTAAAAARPAQDGWREVQETVRQYRDAWRDCIDEVDGPASLRENWDGSDHNLAGFDRVMDAVMSTVLKSQGGT